MQKNIFRKSIAIAIIVLFIGASITITPNMFVKTTKAEPPTENIIFNDNFESYSTGSFPSSGGWQLVWNGKGNEYQKIINTLSYSGTKSFQLWGIPGWSSVVEKRFSTDASVVGYELQVRNEDYGSYNMAAYFGFFNRSAATWGGRYAYVQFCSDGNVYSTSQVLQTWIPDVWYKVRVIVHRDSNTYDVWINDVLKGLNMPAPDSEKINSFWIESDHTGVPVYYDDVKVFEYTEGNTVLELSAFYWSSTFLMCPFNDDIEARNYISNTVTSGYPATKYFGKVILNYRIKNNGIEIAENVILNVKIDLGPESYSDYPTIEHTTININPYFVPYICIGDIAPGSSITVEVEIPIKFSSVHRDIALKSFTEEYYYWDPPVWISANGWITGYASADNADSVERTTLFEGYWIEPLLLLPIEVLTWVLSEVLQEIISTKFLAELKSPSELHLYDSMNQHTGLIEDKIQLDIPNSYYIPEINNREILFLFDIIDEYSLIVKGTHTSSFDLNITYIYDNQWIILSYLNIPETEYSSSTIKFSKNFLIQYMEIDIDGDGIIDEIREPIIIVKSTINIDPNTFNKNSSGIWITCYIELPQDYNINDAEISTIMLNDLIPAHSKPTNIGDYDNDGIPDLMVKFSKSAVAQILPYSDNVEIKVTGALIDGTEFEGIDYIKVI